MVYGLYVIKDEKVGYLQVTQDNNDYSAIRNFRFAMERHDSLFSANKADFRLYKLGTFNSVDGEIIPEPSPTLICDGSSLEV